MKNTIRFIKKYPLTLMIFVSILGFHISTGLHDFHKMKAIKHTSQQNQISAKTEPVNETPAVSLITPKPSKPAAPAKVAPSKNAGHPVQYKKISLRKARSNYYDDYDKIALTTDYPYETGDMDYFDDALFIGDSRVEGLFEYGNLSKSDFLCKEGFTIYDLLDNATANNGKNLSEMLSRKQYGKIYCMIGVNELGRGHAKDFKKKYKEVIKELKKLQPKAIIYITGMMHVTDDYSKKNDVFNNDNINERNTLAASLTDGIQTFYLDMNEAIDDSKGGLISKYTWDGLHLKAEYYKLWVDFMKEHCV